MKTKTNASVEGHLRCNRVHLRTAHAVRGLRCHKLCGIAFILMLLSTTTTSITTITTTTTTTKTKTKTKTLYSYYVYHRGTSAPKAIIYLIYNKLHIRTYIYNLQSSMCCILYRYTNEIARYYVIPYIDASGFEASSIYDCSNEKRCTMYHIPYSASIYNL